MQNRWFTVSNKALIQLTAVYLFISLLITGCTFQSLHPPETQESILPVADSRQIPDVIMDLLKQADQQYKQGDYSGSIATLERAIRIKPRYAEIWSRMAQVYSQQGQAQLAKSYAERSNSYIKNNAELKEFNDMLIQAVISSAEGNLP